MFGLFKRIKKLEDELKTPMPRIRTESPKQPPKQDSNVRFIQTH
jgi:hypothetical protein